MAPLRDYPERDCRGRRARCAERGGRGLTLTASRPARTRRKPRAARPVPRLRKLTALTALAALGAMAVAPVTALGQTIYQYREENGVLVFTDRPPVEGRAFEERSLP